MNALYDYKVDVELRGGLSKNRGNLYEEPGKSQNINSLEYNNNLRNEIPTRELRFRKIIHQSNFPEKSFLHSGWKSIKKLRAVNSPIRKNVLFANP